jgi:hypothetical protein
MPDLRHIACCPRCRSPLDFDARPVRCANPACEFARSGFPSDCDQPVLIDFQESVFTRAAFEDRSGSVIADRDDSGRSWRTRLWALLTGENRVAPAKCREMLQIVKTHAPWVAILVIGGGAIGAGAEALYLDSAVQIIGTDVYASRNTNLVVDRRGMVVGSASAWVPTLEHVNMHLAPARRVWSRYVNPAFPLPEDPRERERARQVSEVLVFDYLAANYDRWNCCNIAADENGDLVFRDNDAGWVPNVINNLGSPGVVRRLPRSLYEAIQRATPEALRASIAQDPEGARGHLIPDQSYTGYEMRRQAMLNAIRRAIARYGEAAVLPWP